MSTNLSAMLTTMPPTMEGSTAWEIRAFSPDLRNPARASSTSFLLAASSSLAVVTVQTTSPLCAAIKVSKEATTALVKPSLLFSARASSRFLLSSFTFRVLHTPPMPSSLMLFLMDGSRRKDPRRGSVSMVAEMVFKSFSTASRAPDLLAAEKRAAAYLPSMPKTGTGVLTTACLDTPVLKLRVRIERFRPAIFSSLVEVNQAIKTKVCVYWRQVGHSTVMLELSLGDP